MLLRRHGANTNYYFGVKFEFLFFVLSFTGYKFGGQGLSFLLAYTEALYAYMYRQPGEYKYTPT